LLGDGLERGFAVATQDFLFFNALGSGYNALRGLFLAFHEDCKH
jgi:hypothetical protein